MGVYLNPGRQSFQMAVNSEIYVDKTDMIGYLNSLVNTQQRYVCVSRPRRFGKTMAADMICAYYGREADSREMFQSRKLGTSAPSQTAGKEIGWDEYLTIIWVTSCWWGLTMIERFKVRVLTSSIIPVK